MFVRLNPFKHIFLLLLLGCSALLYAQLRMESLTVEDGLSQGFVTCMLQDHKGFIWLGTYDGLNRYDGYTVRRFMPNPFDSLSLSSSYITFLHEDAQHFLWVGTAEGLLLFDPLKERFYNFSARLPSHFVEMINSDRAGNILVRFISEQDRVGTFRLKLPSHPVNLNKNPLPDIQIDPVWMASPYSGKFWLTGSIGDTLLFGRDSLEHLFKYDAASNSFKSFELKGLPTGKGIDYNIMWSKQASYVYRQQLHSGADTILPRENWPLAMRMRDGNAGIWFFADGPLVATKNSAAITVDLLQPITALKRQPEFHQAFTTILDGLPTLSNGAVCTWNNRLMVDRSGIIWMGTGGWGVRKINPAQISFGKFLAGKSVSSLRELPDGTLWIRLFNDESFVFNPATAQVQAAPWAGVLGANWLYECMATQNKRFWLIGLRNLKNRLYLFEQDSGNLTNFTEYLPAIDGVLEKIMEDRDGNVWISGHKGHLYRCRPGQRKLDAFSYANLISGGNQNILRTTALAQDKYGTIWIGTNKGLVRIDQANSDIPHFTSLRHDVNNRASLSIDWTTSICPDPFDADLLWIGTRGGGLNRFHLPSQTFSFWTEAPNGLPNNVVYGILPDENGHLWCSTNRGLCCFSPTQKTFITYQESDGLLSTEFNTGSYLRTKDGRFWFGCVSGLNSFSPDALKPQNTAPPVAITGIKVRGVLRFPDEEGLLALYYAENNVSFEFAAMDFASPGTNRFRHRLKGLERDWVYDGTLHSANYAALPPGKYHFELQGATADGPWSDHTVVFTLIIHPPWYRSHLAYGLYFLAAISALFGFIRYREHLFKLENTSKLNQLESERLKSFERIKNQFFINIAHELRTPLTVILGLAKRIGTQTREDTEANNAQQILKQGEQLLTLTNQVLDLAKLDSDLFQLHPETGDFMAFLTNHSQSLLPLASNKGVQMQVLADGELWMAFDQHQWQKILNNLISNAIRHTNTGGVITVKAQYNSDEKRLHISVSDTGEGIPAEDLPRVFERFFQSNNPAANIGASGIGLTLTRDLVQLMGGQISVESTPGAGATFFIDLPVENQKSSLSEKDAQPTNSWAGIYAGTTNGRKPLLLVMEDNADVWHYLQLFLKAYFRLEHASNGQKGIEKAFELIPDLILTDVAMPQKNGYEVTSALKADERTSHIPIAILTAKTDASERMEGHRRGANAYLTKPFDESELLLVLHNLLHLQQQWKTRYAQFPQPQPLAQETGHPVEELQQEDQFMQKVNAIFEANFAQDTFNLESLCRMLNMSSSQLDRKIKALTNQSPMQMLRTFRLQKAQAMLRKDPNITIKEVCFRTGFKSPAHFSRLYSKEFGAPPSAG